MTTQHKAAWLCNARSALEPTSDDQSRVATGLAKTLGPAALGSSFTADPEAAVRPDARFGTTSIANNTPIGLTRFKPGIWLTAGLTIGGLTGYHFGLIQTQRETTAPREAAVPAVDLAKTLQSPHAPMLDPMIEDPNTNEPPVVVTTKAFVGTRSPSAESTVSNVGNQPIEDREVLLLQRVERALRHGDAALALGLLREIDEVAPKGRLLEERLAARVMARCMLNSSGARDEAQRFERQHPNSVHSARLRRACKS